VNDTQRNLIMRYDVQPGDTIANGRLFIDMNEDKAPGNPEPSNFRAISLRYQARMVSGLATRATSPSASRPRLSPISARVARSGSLSRNPFGSFALRIRSPRPDIHSEAEAPGSPTPSHTPAVAPTSCSSYRPPILPDHTSFRFFGQTGLLLFSVWKLISIRHSPY
jgi:hypothetical protein